MICSKINFSQTKHSMKTQRALSQNGSRRWVCAQVPIAHKVCVCMWIVRKSGVEWVSLGKKQWETLLETVKRSFQGAITGAALTGTEDVWTPQWVCQTLGTRMRRSRTHVLSSLAPCYPNLPLPHFTHIYCPPRDVGTRSGGMPWKTSHTNALFICLWSWLIYFSSQFDYFFY